MNKPETADDIQVGGDHYKRLSVQPWDAMEAWLSLEEFIGFLRGNVIKYHARANAGKEDRHIQLQKAGHYQKKLEEILAKYFMSKEYKNEVKNKSQFSNTEFVNND